MARHWRAERWARITRARLVAAAAVAERGTVFLGGDQLQGEQGEARAVSPDRAAPADCRGHGARCDLAGSEQVSRPVVAMSSSAISRPA
jgi:hypothetical protein